MKKILIGCLLASVLFVACDKDDDDDNDNGTEINATDRDFVQRAAMGNKAEVEAGTLASTMADNDGIRDFGMMMMADHSTASAKLNSLADSLSLYAPDSVDAEHVALKAQLMTLTGRPFDSVYISNQVKDHEKTIALFENQVNEGNNTQLKNFAGRTLPELRMHLQHADSLRNNY